MIIRERKWKKCDKCGARHLIQDEAFGCDECARPINLSSPEEERLDVSTFNKAASSESTTYHFCSWPCVFKKLTILSRTCDYFIGLPYLSFDNEKIGTRACDFWEAVREYTGQKG